MSIATLPLLTGKRILVTGGASGIGLAGARMFAAMGAAVFLADRNEPELGRAQEACGAAGTIAGDVTSETDCNEAVRAAADAMGGIDGLFNSAGVSDKVARISDLSADEWQHIVDVNLRGTFLMAKAIAPVFLDQKAGSMVNVASAYGLGGAPRRHAYAPAKAGVVMMTRTLACEWALEGIRVNAIAPGYIKTPMVDALLQGGRFGVERIEARTPLGRFGEPDEIASAAAFLLSDMASYVTGVTLPVDGGWTAYSGPGDVATA